MRLDGDWTWFNQFRWLSNAVFNNADDEFTRNVSGVGDFFIVDTSVAYALNESIDLQVNIDNVFNKTIPYPAVASAFGETAYFSAVLERYATFTVRARF